VYNCAAAISYGMDKLKLYFNEEEDFSSDPLEDEVDEDEDLDGDDDKKEEEEEAEEGPIEGFQ